MYEAVVCGGGEWVSAQARKETTERVRERHSAAFLSSIEERRTKRSGTRHFHLTVGIELAWLSNVPPHRWCGVLTSHLRYVTIHGQIL
jgi:hypothetical protein